MFPRELLSRSSKNSSSVSKLDARASNLDARSSIASSIEDRVSSRDCQLTFARCCTFARAWKLAEVIPLVKSGDADEPSNTRPISLLPIMSKVCERAAPCSLLTFWIKMKKLPSYKMETRNFIQLKQPYFISLMKFLRIWMTKRYL